MLKKLIDYLFKKHAQRYLSSTFRERRFVSYKKAKSIFLLFESEYNEKNPVVRKIISSLQQDGKKVTAWGFIDKKEITTAILPDFRILHHEQTDFFHKPQPAFIRELEDLEFDLLIDLSLKPVVPLQYLALYANASCKVSIRKTELPMYDFIIDLDTSQPLSDSTEEVIDETYLFNQIIFYLKSIQTKD